MSQKTIAVGTVGTPVDIDVNFGNARDNFAELYSLTKRLLVHDVQSQTTTPASQTFSAFYHVYSILQKNSGAVYAIETPLTTKTTQSIYKTMDGGINWSSLGNITLDILGGERLIGLYVEPRGETIVVLKKLATTPTTYAVNTYDSSLNLLGSLNIGKALWSSSVHNIDATVLNGTYTNVIMFSEYVYSSTAVPTVRVWKTVDRGVNWAIVFEQTADNGTTGAGQVKHFHALQVDPFTNDWWLSSGDGNAQCMIWRSQNDGIDWTLMFSGSQGERTLSFVFEQDHIYYGMDSPDSGVPTNIYKITRATMTKEIMATAYNNLAIYALTKTFFPHGFLVWLVYEDSSAPTVNIEVQFFDYTLNKLLTVGSFKKVGTFTGFLSASRYQSVLDGGFYIRPNDGATSIYMGLSWYKSAFLKGRLTM